MTMMTMMIIAINIIQNAPFTVLSSWLQPLRVITHFMWWMQTQEPDGHRPSDQANRLKLWLHLQAANLAYYRPQQASSFIIITEPKSWHSFYNSTEGGRISWPRQCSKEGYAAHTQGHISHWLPLLHNCARWNSTGKCPWLINIRIHGDSLMQIWPTGPQTYENKLKIQNLQTLLHTFTTPCLHFSIFAKITWWSLKMASLFARHHNI